MRRCQDAFLASCNPSERELDALSPNANTVPKPQSLLRGIRDLFAYKQPGQCRPERPGRRGCFAASIEMHMNNNHQLREKSYEVRGNGARAVMFTEQSSIFKRYLHTTVHCFYAPTPCFLWISMTFCTSS